MLAQLHEHGWHEDAWPELWKVVDAADIVIVGTPIWLGQISGVCKTLIEQGTKAFKYHKLEISSLTLFSIDYYFPKIFL